MSADDFIDPVAARSPAADIPGALEQTQQALLLLRDPGRLEQIAVVCLQQFAPSLRRSGGAGDEQRDAVGGSLVVDGDEVVVTVSLEKTWGKKIERDLDGLAAHDRTPKVVWSVTNRRTGAKRRTELEKGAAARWGHPLKVLDGSFLALRLLHPDLLAAREELLGLPAPTWPITRTATEFAGALPSFGGPDDLLGRQQQVDELIGALSSAHLVILTGPGGVGKTRLAVDAAPQVPDARVRFLDAATPIDSDGLHAELAGADRLVLVVDNAHRRDDLDAVVAIVSRRRGDTRLLLVVRPGFDERIVRAVSDSPFADAAVQRRMVLGRLPNAVIGDLVRAAEPELPFADAVQEIVLLAEGNPLIALLAHRVAVDRGGLHGLSRGEVLSSYATPAIDAVAARRSDVVADDYRDCLALVALLGGVTDADVTLLGEQLAVAPRRVRNRLEDLTDAGLLHSDPSTRSVVPDLLAAQIVRDAFFSERQPAIPFAEIWAACDQDQRTRICTGLGGLAGFDVCDRADVSGLLATALRDDAAAMPLRALQRAESVAPGLPTAALVCVDAVLDVLPTGDTERLCRTALGVCDRISDFSAGWPRQLSLAETYYADTSGETTAVTEALTHVYKRLPVNTSRFDGLVLAEVQRLLVEVTASWAAEHAGRPGAARTLALAARQLLTVSSERSYVSAEDDRRIVMSAGFLPPTDTTAAALRSGSALLLDTIGELAHRLQVEAVQPVTALRRCAGGFPGAFGSAPDDGLKRLAQEILDELFGAFCRRGELPLATRSTLADALDRNPWPDDEELTAFRALLVGRPRDRAGFAERTARLARTLADADGVSQLLAQWSAWLAHADDAGLRHLGASTIPAALAAAAAAEPDTMREAFAIELRHESRLAELTSQALVLLFARPDGEQLAVTLLANAGPLARVAVAGGLAGVNDAWADDLLKGLSTDPDARVRSRVAQAAGWTDQPSEARILSGIGACGPDRLDDACTLLSGLGRGDLAQLSDDAGALLAEVVRAAACLPRVDDAGLREVCELVGRPRLAIDALLARVAWLGGEPDSFEDLMTRDGLPEELADLAAVGPTVEDAEQLVGLLERAALTPSARSSAVDLLSWIDPGDVLTDRIARWLAEQDSELSYTAAEVLRHTRDPERFRTRAQRLLSVDPALDITEVLLDARQPAWMVGSERTVMQRLADEFAKWAASDHARLAEVGRAGVARFTARAAAADGEPHDPDTTWG